MAIRLGNFALMCLIFALSVAVANASQEHTLPLTKFRLESVSQTDPGTIVVHGSQDQSGKFQELKVELMGQVVTVPASILQQIPTSSNGVIISSEAGYKELGGRTVYITFLVTWSNARTIRERFVVTVQEDGTSGIIKFRIE
jgi:hypothetical protein